MDVLLRNTSLEVGKVPLGKETRKMDLEQQAMPCGKD